MAFQPEAPIPGFLTKTFELVDSSEYDDAIRWNDDGQSFVITNCDRFCEYLSKKFKHNNLASFTRQLNVYGFRKLESPTIVLVYAHEHFLRGQRLRLKHIRRKEKATPQAAAVPTALVDEVKELKKRSSEDLTTLAELSNQFSDLNSYVGNVLEQNRQLREEQALIMETNAQLRVTLEKVLGMLQGGPPGLAATPDVHTPGGIVFPPHLPAMSPSPTPAPSRARMVGQTPPPLPAAEEDVGDIDAFLDMVFGDDEPPRKKHKKAHEPGELCHLEVEPFGGGAVDVDEMFGVVAEDCVVP